MLRLLYCTSYVRWLRFDMPFVKRILIDWLKLVLSLINTYFLWPNTCSLNIAIIIFRNFAVFVIILTLKLPVSSPFLHNLRYPVNCRNIVFFPEQQNTNRTGKSTIICFMWCLCFYWFVFFLGFFSCVGFVFICSMSFHSAVKLCQQPSSHLPIYENCVVRGDTAVPTRKRRQYYCMHYSTPLITLPLQWSARRVVTDAIWLVDSLIMY